MTKRRKRQRGRKPARPIDDRELTLADLPSWLRGPGNNKWGGQSSLHMRGFRGLGDNPTHPVKIIGGEEKARIVQQMRDRGEID